MNVIDAFVITLGMDTKGYDKGRKSSEEGLEHFRKQSDAMAKQVAEGGKRMAEGFLAVRNQLLGLLATFGAATTIKDFVASNVEGQASLARLSRNLGINTQQLEAWGIVAKEMGGQAQDAFGVLNTLAAGIAEAQLRGHSGLTDAARMFGIDLTGVKTAEDALLRISDRLSKMPRQMALVAANQLGVGGMFNQLMQGPEALRQQLAEAARMSRATDASTHAAERLQKQWALIQLRFKGASEALFAKLSPVLESLANRLADFLDAVNWDSVAAEVGRVGDAFLRWLKGVDWAKVAQAVTRFFSEVRRGIDTLGGLKTVLIALGGLLALHLLAPLASAIGLLGRAIPLLGAGSGGLVGALSGVGTALAAINLTALAGVLGAAGLVYSGRLGGNQRADGSYEDEAARPKGAAPGTDMASLWAKVHGQVSAFAGSADQAAYILATRLYADHMPDAVYRQTAADILRRKITPQDFPGYRPPPPAPASQPTNTAALFASIESKYDLPAGLLDRVYQTESSRGQNVVSPKGAQGPFQLMPGTAAQLGLHGDEVFDTAKSADAAARYLMQLRTLFGGDMTKAVAAYNAGPGSVQKYGGVPPFAETQAYVQKVMGGLAPGALAAARTPVAPVGRQTSVDTHIGSITVNTRATDAQGIARDLRGALQNNSLVALADTGVD